jgi:hypothetical protein
MGIIIFRGDMHCSTITTLPGKGLITIINFQMGECPLIFARGRVSLSSTSYRANRSHLYCSCRHSLIHPPWSDSLFVGLVKHSFMIYWTVNQAPRRNVSWHHLSNLLKLRSTPPRSFGGLAAS